MTQTIKFVHSYRNFTHESEIWLTIPGFPKYDACSTGLIRLNRTKKILQGQIKRKYIAVFIENDKGKRSHHGVHRLIAFTFGNVDHGHKASNLIITHKDGNTHNNSIGNLKVISRAEHAKSIMKKIAANGGVGTLLKDLKNNTTIKFESVSACQEYCNSVLGIKTDIYRFIARKKVIESPITGCAYMLCFCDESKYNTIVESIGADEKWKFFLQGRKKQLYFVSNYGRVKVQYSNKEKLLKQHVRDNGYSGCALPLAGRQRPVLVHRLVADAFVPNPYNHRFVDHIDCIRNNNTATNLKWVKDQLENMQNVTTTDKFHRRRVNVPVLQLDCSWVFSCLFWLCWFMLALLMIENLCCC